MTFCGKESEEGFACLKKGIGAGLMIAKQRIAQQKKTPIKKKMKVKKKKEAPVRKKIKITKKKDKK